ncbi:glycosyltransferase [Olivibacter sitiensis]|uniref:glycosyltransferase n=1 Tax=Olivibacter sitiensis TaxID=376470 RepID=UPI0003FCA52F|nr:glycosyltransferase [Olivibacter sitiensis]
MVCIVSCIEEDWGGSEELWARALPYLGQQGPISIVKEHIPLAHPLWQAFAHSGIDLVELEDKYGTFYHLFWQARQACGFAQDFQVHLWNFKKLLKRKKPNMVVISQGINFDGLAYAEACLKRRIPYILVCQKVVDFHWPKDVERKTMQKSLLGARKIFFVSEHNRRMTEMQFATVLPHAVMVHNPVKVGRRVLPYPAIDGEVRLLCLARLFMLDKGQDMLLQVLSKEKWRRRGLRVDFVGQGADELPLKQMAAEYCPDQVAFLGSYNDIEALWANYHALILPSRSEGMPLSAQEAMALGRPVLCTNVGGNAELVQDGIQGFVGSADITGIDQMLERAWARKADWEEMGRAAHQRIKDFVPPHPEKIFAQHVLQLMADTRLTKVRGAVRRKDFSKSLNESSAQEN